MSPGTLRARAPLRNLPHSGSGFRCRGFGEWPDARDLAPGHHRDMSELDRIDAQIEHLEQRLATAAGFAGASAATALVAGAWTDYFWLVFCGAAGWAALGLGRLALAADDRRRAVDRLVLAGSHDDRCARRRIELASARRQNAVAEGLRDVCMQAHAPTPIAFRVVDPHTVRAVEHELQELAATVEEDAGRVPAEAIVRLRLLIASPESPLLAPHLDADARRRSIEDAERLIARCRADLKDS
jgi:hypothetical protein